MFEVSSYVNNTLTVLLQLSYLYYLSITLKIINEIVQGYIDN